MSYVIRFAIRVEKGGKRLHYYGLRKAPNTLKNNVRISAAESDIIDSLLYPPIYNRNRKKTPKDEIFL